MAGKARNGCVSLVMAKRGGLGHEGLDATCIGSAWQARRSGLGVNRLGRVAYGLAGKALRIDVSRSVAGRGRQGVKMKTRRLYSKTPQRTVKVTLSIPQELRDRMREYDRTINWSGLFAHAVKTELDKPKDK